MCVYVFFKVIKYICAFLRKFLVILVFFHKVFTILLKYVNSRGIFTKFGFILGIFCSKYYHYIDH